MRNYVFHDKAQVMIYDDDLYKWIYLNDEKIYYHISIIKDQKKERYIIFVNSKYLTEVRDYVKFVGVGRTYRWRFLDTMYALKFENEQTAANFHSMIVDNPISRSIIPADKYSTFRQSNCGFTRLFEMSKAPPVPPKRDTSRSGGPPPIPPTRITNTAPAIPPRSTPGTSNSGNSAPPHPFPSAGVPPPPPNASGLSPPPRSSTLPPASGKGVDLASALASAKLKKSAPPAEKPAAAPAPKPASSSPVDMFSELQNKFKKRQQVAAVPVEADPKTVEFPPRTENVNYPHKKTIAASADYLDCSSVSAAIKPQASQRSTSNDVNVSGVDDFMMEELKKFIKETIESEMSKLRNELLNAIKNL